jgi:adenylate cyclase
MIFKNLGKFPKTRKLILPLVIAFLSSILAFLFSKGFPIEIPFLQTAEMKTLDQRFEHRGPMNIKDTSKVVIVGITDQSFEVLPYTVFFPRSYYARAIRNLFDAGAKVVAIDVLFDVRSPLPGDDKVLSETLRKYRSTILAVRNDIDIPGRFKILKSQDFFHNIFMKEDSSIGVVLVGNDPDGVFRRYLPINEFQVGADQYKTVPSFGFAAVSRYLGLGNSVAEDSGTLFKLGAMKIPKYDRTSMLINYPGPSGSFPTYDIWQVLDDSSFMTNDEAKNDVQINDYYDLKGSGVFKDKIVLIGAEYPESGDMKPIPYLQDRAIKGSNLAYGVEIHAAAIETALDGDFLVRSEPWFDFLEMFVGTFLIAMTSFLFKSAAQRSRMFLVIFVPLLTTGAVILGSFQAAFYLFDKQRVVMDIIYPVLGYVFSYVGTVVYQYVSERKQKAAIKSIFSRYVDPSVVNQLVGNPDLVRLGGERKTMTVLFSDIADFTGVSEKLAPEDLVAHLNEYLTVMTGIVFKHRGTLDKYIGDALIAFWGAPIELKDHAYRACQAAIEMTKKLDELHSKWTEEGKPILQFRIGINSGEMVVGNVGGNERFDYTVIGDNVNLASRLEGANKMYRTRILLSEFTYELVKEKIFARELDLIAVKGKTRPVKIYEFISDAINEVGDDKRKLVEFYCTGISKYRNREWTAAAKFFEKALSIDPSDYPSEMYLERSRVYEIEPPPNDWNGVFVMQTK